MKKLLCAAVCVGFCSASFAGDWNQWRGAQRDGAAADSPALISQLPEDGLRPAWTSEVTIPSAGVGGWGSPVVADGKVYLFAHTKRSGDKGSAPKKKFPWLPPEKRVGMTDAEYEEYEKKRRDEDEALGKLYDFREFIYCLDADTGKLAWQNERKSVYSRFLQSGSPAVIDGRLYILGAGRAARCVDAKTGRDMWTTRLPGEFRDEYMMSSFAVADGAALVLCGHLFGIDAASGKLLWEGDRAKTRGTHTSPVVWRTGGREYAICNVAGGDTICVAPRSGEELWRVKSEAGLSTPVIVGDRMITYGNSRKKGLRCFELSPGGAKLAWVFQRVADKGSSPVVVDGYVYVQGDRRLACVDLATGKSAWDTTLDVSRPQYTSLIAADGKVFYALDGLLMFAATPEKFVPLINAKFNQPGLMASEATHRELLGLDKLLSQAGGQEEASRRYQQRIGSQGPMACVTPAIADGRLYLRTKDHLVCYDLRKDNHKLTRNQDRRVRD